MTRTLNLEQIWQAAKHGKVSESDIAACERLLEQPPSEDLHLAILVVGVLRKPDARRRRIIEMYLREGRYDAERYSALEVLCRYWQCWDAYLPDVFSYLLPSTWEDDYALADEATKLLGEYLYGHDNKEAWRRLIEVYDHAVQYQDFIKRDTAYYAIYVGLNGWAKALQTRLDDGFAIDGAVLDVARERAKFN